MNIAFKTKTGQIRQIDIDELLPIIEIPEYNFTTPQSIDLYDSSMLTLNVKTLVFKKVEMKLPHYNMSWIEYHEV
jgi:hypothetical protein